jgi:hypothetical protein
MTKIDPDAARDLIAKIHAHTRAYPHDDCTLLYALMNVAGYVVNGTGPDALAMRRWTIEAFDQAILAAIRPTGLGQRECVIG